MYWVCYIWSNKHGYVFSVKLRLLQGLILIISMRFFFSILDKNIVQYVSDFEFMVKIYIFRRHISNAFMCVCVCLYIFEIFFAPIHDTTTTQDNVLVI